MKSVVLALGSVALSAAAWLCIGTRTMPVLAVSATGIAAVGYGTTRPRFRSSQKFLDEQRKLEESKKQLELSRSEYELVAIQLNNQKLALEQANKLLSQERTQLKETQNKLAIKEEELAQLSNNLSDTDVRANAVTQLQSQLATLEENLTNKQNYLNNLEKEVLATKEHLEEGPMAGVLIYTAAPDSEGTLGGLTSLGEPNTLGRHINQALEQMRLCASDPLCAEHSPLQNTTTLHWATCHACLFSPETSCERGNKYLDRSILVRTVKAAQAELAFFKDMD